MSPTTEEEIVRLEGTIAKLRFIIKTDYLPACLKNDLSCQLADAMAYLNKLRVFKDASLLPHECKVFIDGRCSACGKPPKPYLEFGPGEWNLPASLKPKH